MILVYFTDDHPEALQHGRQRHFTFILCSSERLPCLAALCLIMFNVVRQTANFVVSNGISGSVVLFPGGH